MAVELHVLMRGNVLPNREEWQAAIDRLEMPVQLDPELDPSTDAGFSPCQLGKRTAGFEISRDSAKELTTSYPTLSGFVQGDRVALSFRWGGVGRLRVRAGRSFSPREPVRRSCLLSRRRHPLSAR